MTADWRVRRIGPEDVTAVRRADAFDEPATPEGGARFLGPPGAARPDTFVFVAEQAGRIGGFASVTVQNHPDNPRVFSGRRSG